MKYKAPGKCPVCGERLSITKLGCPKCSTLIEGDFQPCEFCRLPEEDLEFLKVFVKNRGSIKDVERELGYHTHRSRQAGRAHQEPGIRCGRKRDSAGYRTEEAARSEIIEKLSKERYPPKKRLRN